METNQILAGKKIQLPEPDSRNITVLTKKLPTQPILPWLGFNLCWLKRYKYTK